MKHVRVLADEVCDALLLPLRKCVVDATLGLGGHSLYFFQRSDFGGTVVGFDQDEEMLSLAREGLREFSSRVTFAHSNFGELAAVVAERGISFDGILFDLGVASPHFDDASRGFSYDQDAPLDMRLDRRGTLTAADIVMKWSEEELTKLFRDFGEEPLAQLIAVRIVEQRSGDPLLTTGRLSRLVCEVYSRKYRRPSQKHPATRVFQALRIAVNSELEVLERALRDAIRLIEPSGRIAVISYHSLEDRIVKRLFAEFGRMCHCDKYAKACTCGADPLLTVVTKRPIVPGTDEVLRNPRARSAKLRVAEKKGDMNNNGKS